MLNVDKPTWENHLREELNRSVIGFLEEPVTDETPKDKDGNPVLFTPFFLKRDWCPEQKKVFIVPADQGTYDWFCKIYVPTLKVNNWHFKAVPLAETVGTVVLWVKVPTKDLASYRRPADQVWSLVCRHNQFNPTMATFKSCKKDTAKKGGTDTSTISFRATREMVAFIVAGDPKTFRPKYHLYFGMASFPVMHKNKHLHDKVKSPDDVDNLTFEKRGDSAVKL